MPTNARYFPNLPPNQPNDTSLTLIFDYLGNISFQSLHLPPKINYPVAHNRNQLIPLTDVTNACIFYKIAKDLENKVDKANFTLDTIEKALIANMNPAIVNQEEVALEIWTSWQKFFKLTEGRNHPEPNKSPLITNFPEKINRIVSTLLAEQLKKFNLEKASKANSKQLRDSKDLVQLSLTLECITRNMVGMPFYLKLDKKNLLFRLARQLDGFLFDADDKLKNYFLPLQETIQREIINQNGLWIKSLIDFFAYELRYEDSEIETNFPEFKLPDKEEPEFDSQLLKTPIDFRTELSKATISLLEDEFSPLNGGAVAEIFGYIKPTMQLEKDLIDSFLKRENKESSQLMSENTLQEATHFALRKAALNNNIQLEASVIFKFKPTYDFNYFNLVLNHLTGSIGIKKNQIDIFGYILAQMAQITQFPASCKIYEEKLVFSKNLIPPSKKILIELDLSLENINTLVTYLNTTYGAETASLVEEFHPQISLNLSTLIEKILPNWYRNLVTTLLIKDRIKEIYPASHVHLYTPAEQLFRTFQEQCVLLKRKPFNAFMFAEILLKTFHINGELTNAEIFQDENRIDAIFDVDLYLEGISLSAATKLASQINAIFPKAYTTIHHEKSDNLKQYISFDKKLFLDQKFKAFMNGKIKQFILDVPYLPGSSASTLFNSSPLQRQEEIFIDPNSVSCCTLI
ncbi:hypothetical protein ACQUW5_03415 [Legionella sp. CNM-1927-20]|uniref:hypothetical protein n=1 Tax=Legionella sp. CNM-1927-20 TaxID=3422221 RepID=UPI00403B22A5